MFLNTFLATENDPSPTTRPPGTTAPPTTPPPTTPAPIPGQ